LVAGEVPPDKNPYEFAAHASMFTKMDLERPPSSWSEILKPPPAPKRGPIVIIDQVEEIVNVHFGRADNKRSFFRNLGQAIQENPGCRVILVIQQEYLEQIKQLAGGFAARWEAFHLQPLARKFAWEAIRRPAKRVGVEFDDELLRLLVDELATVRFVDALGASVEDPGNWVEPLQLQIVCDSLWSRMPKGTTRITLQEIRDAMTESPANAVDAVRTFIGMALSDFCRGVVERVERDHGYPIALIDLGCQDFILERGGRCLIHQGAQRTGNLPNDIVNALESRHLLRLETRGGERWFELAHVNLVAPVGDRGKALDTARLEELWREAVNKIARSDAEAKIDPENLLTSCLQLLDRNQRPKPLAIEEFVNELSGVPQRAADALLAERWIRLSFDGRFYELAHPRLAAGLAQIVKTRETLVRPFNLLVRVVFPCVPAVAFTILFEFIVRSALARFQLTLTQASDSFAMAGWFQGLVGGFVWGVLIALALSWWIFVPGPRKRTALERTVLCAAMGTAAGLLGGSVITVAVLFGQTPPTVKRAGWTTSAGAVLSAFTETRLGYTELIYGAAVGLSCALVLVRILGFDRFIRGFVTPRTVPQAARVGMVLLGKTLRTGLPLFTFIIGVAALLIHSILPASISRFKVFGEAASIGIGGVAIIFGLVFGVVAQTWDLEIGAGGIANG
jgi:hypothetical protein